MAECHPVGFQWVMEAKLRGAKAIHVDPRFTRTSATASLHVPLRAGSDIAFLGGILNYILEHGRWFDEYVKHYTSAPVILHEDFKDTEDFGSRGAALVGAQEAAGVGRRAGKVGGRRRARLRGGQAALVQAPDGAKAQDAIGGTHPFVMQADGRGWLFVPSGIVDGPLPTHYEPHESPFENPLYAQQANPARQRFPRPLNEDNDERHPYVVTTYRLTEHHTAGGMSRIVDSLSELQPEMFCELSPELAAERSLEHGGWATISSAWATIEARVLVTPRIAPRHVGLPYHWGFRGLSKGDSANEHVAPRRLRRAGRAAGLPLAHFERRLQALHARRLPRGLPDRRARPHRVRHRRTPPRCSRTRRCRRSRAS
jgi:anaerobic selenocysteine-containing dehydrogenase